MNLTPYFVVFAIGPVPCLGSRWLGTPAIGVSWGFREPFREGPSHGSRESRLSLFRARLAVVFSELLWQLGLEPHNHPDEFRASRTIRPLARCRNSCRRTTASKV